MFFERQEWWKLVPDQTVFASGGETNGQILNLAARHQDGRWVMVHLAGEASFSVNLDKLQSGRAVSARWLDPRTGQARAAGPVANSGAMSFAMPVGWEDALLILEPESR